MLLLVKASASGLVLVLRYKSMLLSSTSTANAKNNDARGQANDGTVTLSQDEIFLRLRHGAAAVVRNEPILCTLLAKVGLLDTPSHPATASNVKLSATFSHRGRVPLRVAAVTAAIADAAFEPASSLEEAASRIMTH